MEKIIINGGTTLEGEVKIGGSKNSVVALIPAAILCQDKVKIYNYPNIADVKVLIKILKELNVKIKISEEYLEIDSSSLVNTSLYSEEVTKLRASYYFMGALLTLFNQVDITMPGGCDLGYRPIDLHVVGLKKLNCDVNIDDGKIHLKSNRLTGSKIFLDIPSVGATINIMLAAVLASGETLIENAAKEPEIVDVANFLNKMGANIKGAGTCLIKITGVKKLKGTDHKVIPDRIEAGTYLLYGAALGREVKINNVDPEHLHALISKIQESNIKIIKEKDKLIVYKSNNILPVNIRTSVYPGFPTDLQQIITTYLTQANGTSIINETIYSQRFKNVKYLVKMGAKIRIENNQAIIFGRTLLRGTEISATDLRGGASLVFAGLLASGITKIDNVAHIFRGYSNIVENLRGLNADIKLINE